MPYASATAVVADYGDALDGKVIIDVTDPAAADLSSLHPNGSSGAQETAKCLRVSAQSG